MSFFEKNIFGGKKDDIVRRTGSKRFDCTGNKRRGDQSADQ